MKAAVLTEFGMPLMISEVPIPVPAEDEVLVRVKACGIDGTDLKLCKGLGYAPKLPFVMGHEFAGEVAETGSAVDRWNAGDRVIPYIFVSPACDLGQAHRDQMSDELSGVIGVDGYAGGYAEYVCVPQSQLMPLPAEINWEDAAVLCDGALTAYHAFDRSKLRAGRRAALIGIGGVGAFALQIAVHAGVDVVALDRSMEKLDWARTLGAKDCICVAGAGRSDVRPFGESVDCVLDFVGSTQTFELGKELLAKRGRYVFVGYSEEGIEVFPKELSRKELSILGSRGGSRADLRAVVNLAATGKLESIVTSRRRLEEVNDAHDALAKGNILGRCVLLP